MLEQTPIPFPQPFQMPLTSGHLNLLHLLSHVIQVVKEKASGHRAYTATAEGLVF